MQTTILFKAPGKPNNKPVVILNALSLRQSLTLGTRALPRARMLRNPLLSFFNAVNIAVSQYSAELCSAFHTERAMKPVTPAGNNFASTEPYSVPTPVWSVNAPTARSEWNATGKRNRFSFIRAIV